MGLMNDFALREKITAGELVIGLDASKLHADVHGCAVEIHIGDIYVPGSRRGETGSAGTPRRDLPHSLGEGETAVITTLEQFSLDRNHTALVFPVSSVSFKGLLMTNPGHVDPGFEGALQVTVINMGRKHFSLERGGRFLRALIFELDGPVGISGANAKTVTDELLETLSPDFLSVKERGTAAAKSAVDAAVRTSTLVTFFLTPLLAGLLAAGATWLSSTLAVGRYADRLDAIERQDSELKASERLTKLETDVRFEQRLKDIERALDQIKQETPSGAR